MGLETVYRGCTVKFGRQSRKQDVASATIIRILG
jgi:hypothetical protein